MPACSARCGQVCGATACVRGVGGREWEGGGRQGDTRSVRSALRGAVGSQGRVGLTALPPPHRPLPPPPPLPLPPHLPPTPPAATAPLHHCTELHHHCYTAPLPLHHCTDTAFLSGLGVMDYSLLLGVDRGRRELVVGIIDYCRQVCCVVGVVGVVGVVRCGVRVVWWEGDRGSRGYPPLRS